MSNTESSPVSPFTPKTTPLEVGQNLAECYVLTQLAIQSPTGDVWLADDEVLGRDVSLRFVPEAVRSSPPLLQELRQEIKRNRQLIHPQILRTYDLVEEPEWAAISMDSFEAEPVSALLKKQPEGRFTAAAIQPWVTQLIQALEDAHRINFLHRDLSPANLLLDKEGKLLITNFGISDVIRRALSKAGATGVGNGLVSPQIAEGKDATRSDDIYALGAVLFTLTTGAALSAGLDILKKETLGIPAAWQKTIAACLSQDPKARPESAAEVGKLLAAESTSPVAAAASPAVAATAVVAGAAAVVAEKTKTALEQPKARFESASVPGEEGKSVPEAAKASGEAPKAPGDVKPAVTDDSEIVPKRSVPKKEPEVVKEAVEKEPTLELVKDTPPKKAPAKKPAEPKAMPMPYSGYESTGSRFPVAAIAGAAALIVVGAIVLHFSKSKPADAPTGNSEPQTAELNAVNNATPPPVVNADPATAPATTTDGPPAKSATKEPMESPKPDEVTPKVAVAVPSADVPAPGKVGDQDPEKARAELLQKKQQAEASVADTQKLIDEKTKAAAALKKSLADSAPQKKKIEAEQKAALAAAEEAQKVAAEKTRVAEEAKKAAADFDKKNEESLAAQQAAESELQALQKSLADKQREVETAAKTAADLEKASQERLAAMKKAEEDAAKARMAAADAEKAAAEAQKKKAADDEKTAAKAAIAEQMEALKRKLEDLEKQATGKTAPPPMPATPAPTVKAATPVPLPATPPPTVVKGQKSTPTPLAPAPLPQAGPSAVSFPPADTASSPPVNLVPTPPAPAVTAAGGSLGLKFVPVGDVEFCVWPTRVKDFEQFAKAVNLKSNSWKNPGFKQGLDHPVVNVTWNEAVAFCKWLTEREHKDGTLPANQYYRLPTDIEWSKAAGLPAESGSTPEARDMGVPGVYPWGTAWPPPQGAGNYTGEETGSDVAIRGYDDGFAWTSPAGAFPPNALGLYDMGGNVWQWCMDNWNNESKAKVLRGASWYNGALKLSLLTSCRVSAGPDSLTDNYGFRIVRATDSPKAGKK